MAVTFTKIYYHTQNDTTAYNTVTGVSVTSTIGEDIDKYYMPYGTDNYELLSDNFTSSNSWNEVYTTTQLQTNGLRLYDSIVTAPDPNVINNGDQMIISTVIKNGVEYDISGDLAGKTLIADAITDKGVQTSASDSFQTMASNIESINTHDKANNVLMRSVGSLMGEVKYSGSTGAIASALFEVCGIRFAVAGTYKHYSDNGYNDRGLLAVYEDGRSYFFSAFKTASTDYSFSTIATFYVDDPNKVYIIIGSNATDQSTTTAAGYVILSNGKYKAVFPSDGEPIPTGTRTFVPHTNTGTYPMLNITNNSYFRHVLFINNHLS